MRPVRPRLLVAAGAAIALVACALPWGRTAGVTGNLPVLTYAFDGPAVLVLIAAAGALALLAVAHVAPDAGGWAERPLALAAVVAIAFVGLVVRSVQLLDLDAVGLPDRSPGLWLAAFGVALMAWGVARMTPEARSA